MKPNPPFAAATLLAAMALAPGYSVAQDAVRGATLYRELPGQALLGSCVSCHGEPINNRNSVLRGAAGAGVISRTITAVARMGYLRQYLTEAELGDIAAYLATIVPAGPVDSLPEPWPTIDEFGAQQVGTQSSARVVLIRNLQPRADIVIGAVLASDPVNFPVQHDCPLSLPPFGQCSVTTWFRPQSVGPAVGGFTVVDTGGRLLRAGVLNGTGVAAAPPILAWAANTPALLDFGQVPLGQTARRELLLTNSSPTRATVSALRITGPNASRFTLDAPCAVAGRLEPLTTCAVTLGFAPSSAGRAEAWIELVSDASNATLVRIAAAGVAAAEVPPVVVPPVVPPAASAPSSSGGGAVSSLWLAMLLTAVLALRWRRDR